MASCRSRAAAILGQPQLPSQIQLGAWTYCCRASQQYFLPRSLPHSHLQDRLRQTHRAAGRGMHAMRSQQWTIARPPSCEHGSGNAIRLRQADVMRCILTDMCVCLTTAAALALEKNIMDSYAFMLPAFVEILHLHHYNHISHRQLAGFAKIFLTACFENCRTRSRSGHFSVLLNAKMAEPSMQLTAFLVCKSESLFCSPHEA